SHSPPASACRASDCRCCAAEPTRGRRPPLPEPDHVLSTPWPLAVLPHAREPVRGRREPVLAAAGPGRRRVLPAEPSRGEERAGPDVPGADGRADARLAARQQRALAHPRVRRAALYLVRRRGLLLPRRGSARAA